MLQKNNMRIKLSITIKDKTSIFRKLLLCLFLSLLWSTNAHSTTTYYIAKHGNNNNEGSSEHPFKTMPHALSIAVGGDTIIIKSGVYNTSDIGKTWIFTNASNDARIYVRGEFDDHYSVTLQGFYVIKGDSADIRYIKFDAADINPTYTGAVGIISIGASNITIANCFITGRDDYLSRNYMYDGIKILGKQYNDNELRPYNIIIKDSLIKNCPEDGIDNTGAYQTKYVNNIITRVGMLQVKGGTEDLTIERNKIYNTKFGIITGGMADNSGYVGNAEMIKLPVSQRFGGKNIRIMNNVMFDIDKEFLKPGWVDSYIVNNTFDANNTITYALALVDSTMKYYDDEALNSNLAYNHDTYNDLSFAYIKHKSKNLVVKNNIFYDQYPSASLFYSRDQEMMDGYRGEDNLYATSNNQPVRFFIQDQSMYGVANFTNTEGIHYENESSLLLENTTPGFLNADSNDYRLTSSSQSTHFGHPVFDVNAVQINAADYRNIPRASPQHGGGIGAYGKKPEVLHIRFDGETQDNSSLSHIITKKNGPTYSRGVIGKSISLNGDNQFLSIENHDTLNLSDQLTLSAWIKRDSTGGNDMIIGKHRSYIFSVKGVSNKLYFNLHDGTRWAATTYGLSRIPDNQWTHVSATYSRDTQEVRLYVNGVLDNKKTLDTAVTINSNHYDLEIGRTWSNWAFDGEIDDVRVFPVALNDSQVLSTMQEDSQVLWLKFQNSSLDVSGFDNHGEMENTTPNNDKGYYKGGLDASNGGYVMVPHNSTLDMADELTLSAWVKRDHIGRKDIILAKEGSYTFGIDNIDKLFLDIKDSNNTDNSQIALGSTSIPKDSWTYVTVSYSKSKGLVHFYVNCILDRTISISQPLTIPQSTSSASIGLLFDGFLDDVQIKNRAINGLSVCRSMLDQ